MQIFALILLISAQVTHAGLFDNANPFASQDGPLPVEEAFVFGSEQDGGKLKLVWTIPNDYYLYRDKIELSHTPELIEADRRYSVAEQKQDPLFGQVWVYHNQAIVELDYNSATELPADYALTVNYQGCWDGGICYPPVTKTINLSQVPVKSAALISSPVKNTPASVADNSASAAPQSVTTTPISLQSEQDQFAALISGSSLLLTLGAFFVAGLALALTPCVFPMIPILSSIIAGQGHRTTAKHGFLLSLVYVLSVSVTYTAAGVFAGLFGENLQAAFQNVWIISFFSLIFVLLSLSMFGFYELQLPNSWQSRLNKISNHQKGGTVMGVAVMGLLSALIVGPCMAAPLAGALIYIGQTGDPLLGGAALFTLSLGMGVPLLIVGASAGKLLPKAGAWMDSVKSGFGVMMLLLAVWMLDRIISDSIALLLYAVILLVSAVHMKALDRLKDDAVGWRYFWKGIGVVLLLYGGTLFIGGLTGGTSLLQPLKGFNAGSSVQADASKMAFVTVTNEPQLNQLLSEAKAKGQPVMLDFYADWCISCVELDLVTFADSSVQRSLDSFLRVKVDVTANDAAAKQLNETYSVIGPPALIFFDKAGQLKPNMTLIGVIDPDVFVNHVALLN
ncbi:protein-disulfide reductase DsbD [Amphritea balenae]|uniref:Thiol:disulfide interchange protein DsbD n=1 Tax=Amphritea balenae TaxID=452629 RepID=A0A3P1SL91_9GAMM|nr:protein-disulfide reductase DsbD [Amphritea balenae]RRC97714.1 protein-disulfide reductase DsbD [Amphritea balenae]GGK82398.1 thiol:disulfide interchange protein DsbD [Amphritea balenae]